MENKVSELTEEQLVARSKESEECIEELLSRYKQTIQAIARRYFLSNGDVEDLIQEGNLGLVKAVKSYNGSVPFKNYAYICINSMMLTAIKKSQNKKNMPLANYISLSGSESDDVDKNAIMLDESFDPEQTYINTEDKNELIEKIKNSLSKMEYEILVLYLEGCSYIEIAKKTGKNNKSIDNAIQRIKNKVRVITEK